MQGWLFRCLTTRISLAQLDVVGLDIDLQCSFTAKPMSGRSVARSFALATTDLYMVPLPSPRSWAWSSSRSSTPGLLSSFSTFKSSISNSACRGSASDDQPQSSALISLFSTFPSDL